MIAAGLVCFAASVLYAPESGFLRTLPFMWICGFVCELLGVSFAFCSCVGGVLSLCVHLAFGKSVEMSVLCSAFAAFLVLAGHYASKLLRFLKQGSAGKSRSKCLLFLTLSVLVPFVLNAVFCGNVVSSILCDAANTRYIETNYGDKVEISYTSYDLKSREYRTYISFNDGTTVVGVDDECFVSKNTDGCRDYYEDKMLYEAEKKLSTLVAKKVDAFEVTSSNIVFEKDEILPVDAVIDDYMNRAGYVVSFYGFVNNKAEFSSMCKACVEELKDEGFEFCEIVFCGGNASQVLYSATVNQTNIPADINKLIKDFEESDVEKYGVTEMTVLDYWNNK